MSMLLFMLAASPWAFPAPPVALPTREQVMARVAACGVRPPRVSIQADPDMGGEDVIRIGPGPKLRNRQHACLARASIESFTFVQFDDHAEQQAFLRTYGRATARLGARLSRERLKAAGLLDKVPRYDPKRQALRDYLKAIETLCGQAPGSMLVPNPAIGGVGPAFVTIDLASPPFKDIADRMTCITDVMAASNLADYGIAFGVVGGEMAGAPADAK